MSPENAELGRLVAAIEPLDQPAMAAARARQDRLTKPPGSLGRLEELSIWLAGVRAIPQPVIANAVIVTAAADHGIAQQGVSAYPAEVTPQMVINFLAGGAAINVLARQAGARVLVVDAGVDADLPDHPALIRQAIQRGTADISSGPAMTRAVATEMVLRGARLAQELARATETTDGIDAIGIGDMGIGNTTPAAAITAIFAGLTPSAVTGRGTGVGPERYAEKVRRVELALAVNSPDPLDGLDVLAKVGGLEIGFLAGVCLGGAVARRPVILDGFIAGSAALIAVAIAPSVTQFLLAAHRSVEPGHLAALACLGLEPLLDLRLRLGEGTGAALGLFLLQSAAHILNDMATFDEAGVSGADSPGTTGPGER